MTEVSDAYGRIAERYIGLFGSVDSVDPDDLSVIERHLGGLDGPVLDVGCGPGHLTAHLRSLGVDARGVEPVLAFVEHARATHPEVPVELGTMEQLTADDATAAGILSWYSTIHTPPDELGSALCELRRVLRPGGRLVLGFFEGEAVEAFPHKVTTAYRWPTDELSRRVAAAGFDVIEQLVHPAQPEREVRAHATIAAVARDCPR